MFIPWYVICLPLTLIHFFRLSSVPDLHMSVSLLNYVPCSTMYVLFVSLDVNIDKSSKDLKFNWEGSNFHSRKEYDFHVCLLHIIHNYTCF